MKKVVFITNLILFLLAIQTIAQIPKNIEIEGNEFIYSKDKKSFEVLENVSLVYKDYQVSTNHMIYDNNTENVKFNSPFTFYNQSQSLNGENLNFNFKSKTGQAQNIHAKIDKLLIKGKKLEFYPNKIIIYDGFFSSCSIDCDDVPTYYLTSERIEYYYIVGLLIAQKNKAHVKYSPFAFPFPYYVYGSSKSGIMNNSNVIPEIGSSQIEGTYAKQQLSYIENATFSGAIKSSISENLGTALGSSNIYRFSNQFYSYSNFLYYFNDHFVEGKIGLNYTITHDKNVTKPSNIFEQLSQNIEGFNIPSTEFQLIYQENEIIHNSFVSYKPELKMNNNKIKLGPHFETDISTSIANTEEGRNNPLKKTRKQYIQTIYRDYHLTETLTLDTNTFLDMKYYNNVAKKIFLRLQI